MSWKQIVRVVLGAVLLSIVPWASSPADPLEAGDVAPDFTLFEFGTDNLVSLYDFEDEIVILDFFAYWCGPCKTATSELEPYVQAYYRDEGGNPSGIPVRILSVNIQSGSETQTQAYIDDYGLDLALDDPQRVAYSRYDNGYIPRFAVVNGAAGANYDQWEILSVETGYSRGQYLDYRSVIEGVVLIPEPATLWLLAAGGLVLSLRRRSR